MSKLAIIPAILPALIALSSCAERQDPDSAAAAESSIRLNSSDFEEGGMIPERFSAYGQNLSPTLWWESVPPETESFALIADDPDAPRGTFVHWVIYNIPAAVRELQQGVPRQETLPNGAVQGRNGFGQIGYGGPKPPSGTHRYFFKLYALDTALDLKPGATKADLVAAMEGHILARGELMGRYAAP